MLLGKHPIGTIGYMGGVMTIPEEFTWSLAQMIQFNSEVICEPNEFIHLVRSKISYHAVARNDLVRQMLGDWLFMLDTDHQFEPDILCRMLHIFNEGEFDILSALYLSRAAPHIPVIYGEGENGLYHIGDWEKFKEGPREILEIKSAGAGCLLVRKSVFQKIRDELDEGPFDIIHPFGEDHSFFKRCQKLGIKAYCAPFIESHHLKMNPLTLEQDYNINDVILKKLEA